MTDPNTQGHRRSRDEHEYRARAAVRNSPDEVAAALAELPDEEKQRIARAAGLDRPPTQHEPTPERLAQQRDLDERLRQQRQARHGLRYIAASDNLVKIKRLARETLGECQGVEFDAEERELLGNDIDQTIAALNLLKAGVVGAVDVNWDAELAKLGDLS